jgi:hypothetical protein
MAHESRSVQLAMGTYDTAFDTLERLGKQALEQGEEPSLGISFNATGVSVHDIELLLLDQHALRAPLLHPNLERGCREAAVRS